MSEEPTAFEHLQRAASEVIAAARAALDTLDSVVADAPRPEALLGQLMKWVGGAAPVPGEGPTRDAKPVEHIHVR